MSQETNIRQLVINKLTDAQYEQAVKSADELYLTPDSGSGGGTDLPDQTGQSGKFLTTNGSTLSWGSVPAGTVTSVQVQAGTGLTSSTSTAQSSTLNTTISIASGYKLPTTTEWSGKQDTISDLATIRSGAEAGATAVQPGDLATVATTGSYNDLTNKPTIDSELSTTSTNAAQNKIITTELDKKFQQNDVIQNLSPHNFSQRTKLWFSDLDNTLYLANKRFTVTLTDFNTAVSTNLFNMNWDNYVSIDVGKTGIINITGSRNLGMEYPYGYIYLSFYGSNSIINLSQVSARVYQNWSGHNTGWVNLDNKQTISTSTSGGVTYITVVKIPTEIYGIEQIEISINNTDGTGKQDGTIWVSQLEFFCKRTGVGSLPVLTKLGGTVYNNITISPNNGSFVGNLTGNADTATKATKDGDGNTITSTYVPNTRKVNNKALSSDITLTASDVGALPDNTTIPQGTVTSVRVQAGTGLSSSVSTAQSTSLDTTISIASGYKLPTTTEWNNKQDALPSQSGQSGKYLTTNGSTLSWGTVDALPSQSGQSGKFLTTNGSTASWSESMTWTYNASTENLTID